MKENEEAKWLWRITRVGIVKSRKVFTRDFGQVDFAKRLDSSFKDFTNILIFQ